MGSAASKRLLDEVTSGASKPRTAAEIATDSNIVSITEIIKRTGQAMDTDKATVSVALLNTFNLAVQKLGGRLAWNARDYMAFGVALSALDQVTPNEEIDYSGGREETEN